MNIMEMMNYRYENPTAEVAVDTKITEKFISRERENIEFFELWSSMSKEADKILPVITNYKQEMSYSKEEGFAKAA